MLLYPTPPTSAVERERAAFAGPTCEGCALHKGARTPCIAPDGKAGGVLVVAGAPSRADDLRGRPWGGHGEAEVRQMIARTLPDPATPVVYDYGVRCPTSAQTLGAARAFADACRQNSAAVLADVRPSRVLLFGALACHAYLGRTIDCHSARRTYEWLPEARCWVFVFPAISALQNRFALQQAEDDLAWALTFEPPPADYGGRVLTVETPDEVDACAAACRDAGGYALDVETAGKLRCAEFRLVSLAVVPYGSRDAWVADRWALADPAIKARFAALLADPRLEIAAHNAKFDLQACDQWLGSPGAVRAKPFDTMLMRKLDSADVLAGLEHAAGNVGMGGHKGEAQAALDGANRIVARAQREGLALSALDGVVPDPAVNKGVYSYGLLPEPILARYNARDTLATARLAPWLKANVRPEAGHVWNVITAPLLRSLTRVEQWGLGVDRDAIDAYDAALTLRIDDLRARLDGHGLTEPGSNQQVAVFLYDTLGLLSTRTTPKGAPSVDEQSLLALHGLHPAVDDLLAWRSVEKQRSTYARGMKRYVADDGRIHTDYRIDGAETGRLSSRTPNLQNIPRPETPEARQARDVFCADPGNVLLQFDYSQLEVRVAAMLSQDPVMLAQLSSGEDFHTQTARLITPIAWRDSWDAIDPLERKKRRTAAKAIVFGLLYGQGDKALAMKLGCSHNTATKVREAVLGAFKHLHAWIKRQHASCRRTGEVWTWWDGAPARRRPLWNIASPEDGYRINAENAAVNTPVQGTGADFCNASLTAITEWVIDEQVPARVVLTVHDSIALEVERAAVPEVYAMGKRIMEGWRSDGVVMVADCEIGRSWGSLVPYDGGLLPA